MSERVKQKLSEIDKEANDMQRELEKRHVRKLQKKSFLCGAKCCDDTNGTAEEVKNCIEACQQPLISLQNNLKQELERFQNRIQRCLVSCQDSAQDDVSSVGEALAKERFDSCLYKCAEDHLALLPSVKQRLHKSIPSDL